MAFQGMCLVNNGEGFMFIFDNCPPAVRQMLSESPFDICAACFADACREAGVRLTSSWWDRDDEQIAAIVLSMFENAIRTGQPIGMPDFAHLRGRRPPDDHYQSRYGSYDYYNQRSPSATANSYRWVE